jgi:3-deoxy-manno-octulosonate cytidylyltransferase (CMP-KDO synthetase)
VVKKLPEDFVILIPARYSSSRFPGKPLQEIDGIPMVVVVAKNCLKIAKNNEQVVVVTDDERIQNTVKSFGINCVITSGNHSTGTDRIAEIASNSKFKNFINVQGDEPMVTGLDVLKVVDLFLQFGGHVIASGYCNFQQDARLESLTIPKVVISEGNKMIYASRMNVPANHKDLKAGRSNISTFARQVCIYAFSKKDLLAFANHGKRTPLENQEDIEILRFIELGMEIRLCEVDSTIAVDTPGDLELVRQKFAESKP